MEIKPFKTEADYEAALKEIENLFDAKPGTPKGDRLYILITLVEAYEDDHWLHQLDIPAEVLIKPYNVTANSSRSGKSVAA